MLQLLSDDLWMLKRLQSVGYKSAIIAGGAVRDAYFDEAPRDIDIFVWQSYSSDELIHPDFKNLNEENIAKLFEMDTKAPTHAIGDPFDLSNLFLEATDLDEDQVEQMGMIYEESRHEHIRAVYNVWKASFETEYQLILLNKPPVEYVTRYFDIGLCMAYCDGVRMRFTNEFLRDANNKTLTICGELSEREYHMTLQKHVEKLKHRFPGFTVVDLLKGKFAKA